MSVYYPSGCEDEQPQHTCSTCDSDREHARVRSVAFIRKDFVFIDPTSPTEWTAGIEAGQIMVIPETNGSFDPGSPVEGAGYGDNESTILGFKPSLKYKDPNYKQNYAFYRALKGSRNWKVAYRTESQTHLVEVGVTILPKNPVADDLQAEVVWDVEVKWADDFVPEPFDTPDGIFECFAVS